MKIQRPDEAEIRVEHHSYYRGKSQKAMAAAACVSSTVWSRRLDPNETIVKNPPFEVITEMAASVETNQPEIGKGIYGMIRRHAVELGLVDEQPVDILQLAIERLRTITEDDIKKMSQEERFEIQGLAGELEMRAQDVKRTAIRIRNNEQPRGIELDGGGVIRSSRVGTGRT